MISSSLGSDLTSQSFIDFSMHCRSIRESVNFKKYNNKDFKIKEIYRYIVDIFSNQNKIQEF